EVALEQVAQAQVVVDDKDVSGVHGATISRRCSDHKRPACAFVSSCFRAQAAQQTLTHGELWKHLRAAAAGRWVPPSFTREFAMTGFSIPMLRTTSLALLCVASLAAVQPVRAQIHAHVRAGKSPRGSAISAGYTNASNGTVQHQGGRILHGANGASYAGHNSFSRNADG